ncbi:S1C family serine protease [Deinococcus peraridilitoris]|uniref:Trypsin-like serine protease with C-terminal PDZ domain protein n=1 Tax=Deinococcus peraridilitoris (strain DSM 19664 / LMG 22246 / CIP 109416 / KR-200) TaxID=937777 RepID=L0A8T1_DEIPD|nr:trypsin-like peptidase domain-containing protein [Deinococcus peraridilitoris]AFZ69557.1 trypsin-like serine protease with C-terminal PDZ domain protein [Deinococcus peraridilitoris DSM 19664]
MISDKRPLLYLLSFSLVLTGCRDERTANSTPSAQETPGATATDLLAYEQNTVEVAEEQQDGVVFVTRLNQPQGTLYDPNSNPTGSEAQPSGSGSGFFIDGEGYALTNYHVIEGADQVSVRLHGSNREFPARVVGTAPDYDLALLKTEVPDDLYDPMELGDSDQVKVGQKAIALGAPFGLEFTVTQGIISAKNRVIPTGMQGIPQNSIQTDTAINPGNSGGPLVTSNGRVIGVNTQILSPGTAQSGVGQNAGVGFAIPINVAKALLTRLKAGEEISVPRIGVGGIPIQALDAATRQQLGLPDSGVLVQEVAPGGPAADAGLQVGNQRTQVGDTTLTLGGDIITEVDDRPVTTLTDVQSVLVTKQPGESVTLTVLRDGEPVELQLALTAPEGTR